MEKVNEHTVLCVDDEENILRSLKRLLRREDYRLLTASSGPEGLEVLRENDVHLIICDQRMAQMSGTEFLAEVKEKYPDTIRVVLSGYTDVDAITDSINKGHVYKFLLKPWNDQSLKLEIRQALDQYDLVRANKDLDKKVLEQNEELKKINENLEAMVKERTQELEIQNQVLELSRVMLDDLPVPLIGVSSDGLIAVVNKASKTLVGNGQPIVPGQELSEHFPESVAEEVNKALTTGKADKIEGYPMAERPVDILINPLSEHFAGRGVIMIFNFRNEPLNPSCGTVDGFAGLHGQRTV